MKEKIKLITDEDNFKCIDILLRKDWISEFDREAFNRLKKYWNEIIVENIRKEKGAGK